MAVLPATEVRRFSAVGKSARSEPLIVSSFLGGLNNVADITTIREDELHRMENFELDSNGTLVSRPAIHQVAESPVVDAEIDLHGYYTDSNEDVFLIVSCSSGTYLYDIENETYTQITALVASGAAQFEGNLYISCATAPGGYYNGTTFIQLSGGATPMPQGEQLILYKSRFFMISRETGSNKTRIWFSNITTAGPGATSINEWDPDNYFNVEAGDGQFITKIVAATSEIYIFRSKSTFYYRYTATPGDGILEALSRTVGADNKYSVQEYQFSYLVLSGGRLYRFVSYQFYPLNDVQRVQFAQNANTLTLSIFSALSVFGDRALVWFGGSMYALDLEKGSWSEWVSDTHFAWGLVAPRRENDLTPDVIYGITGLNTTSLQALYQSIDSYGQVIEEEMTCIAESKAFDFGMPDSWKRLFYWAADVYTARDVVGTADPIQFVSQVSDWDDFEDGTWDDLEIGTWDNPTAPAPSITTTLDYPVDLPYRLTTTFQKDMRFRRCSFSIQLTTDGTTSTGPVRVVSLSIHAVGKRGVSANLE